MAGFAGYLQSRLGGASPVSNPFGSGRSTRSSTRLPAGGGGSGGSGGGSGARSPRSERTATARPARPSGPGRGFRPAPVDTKTKHGPNFEEVEVDSWTDEAERWGWSSPTDAEVLTPQDEEYIANGEVEPDEPDDDDVVDAEIINEPKGLGSDYTWD